MSNESSPSSTAPSEAPDGSLKIPLLVPCLMLRRGQVCLPGPKGPVRVRTRTGPALDPFDVVDRLEPDYDRLYLVDLDGIERGVPQLEYIQELSRDMDLWVDAGVATADSAIDILVAGAQRAVLSSSHLRGPVELKRAWKLSTDWAYEVELVNGRVQTPRNVENESEPPALVQFARGIGITDVIVSPREQVPDWGLIQLLAEGGPTWVDGTFGLADQPRLSEAGAAGGIFHLDKVLADLVHPIEDTTTGSGSVSPRDDED